MDALQIAEELVKRKEVRESAKKIVLLVLDGVGDIRHPENGYRTPLDEARTPNLDALAPRSALGRIIPVDYGITPGSGPAHLGLFGYDPRKVEIGRGVLEVVGMGMELQPGDVAARANFCTVRDGKVLDRRAGRPATEVSAEKVRLLQEEIGRIGDVELIMQPGKGHRFGIIFRGPGLAGGVSDTDPHENGEPVHEAVAETEAAGKTAQVVNEFVRRALQALEGGDPINGVLTRGIAGRPDVPTLQDRFGLRCGAIATYPMYRGLASLVGMDVLATGQSSREEFQTYLDKRDDYDFFFIHIKPTDEAGEDGDHARKTAAIEDVDEVLPMLTESAPEVLAITGDHSTPCPMKLHSWHPVPLLLHSPRCGADCRPRFTEEECNVGSLGIFHAMYLFPLMVANAGLLDKYGA
ncbi:MAG: 2,3-bisphosphoglycerate-independent phosphoglycerate mutase [Candidatus Brocadiae bacterium]|nr:2,3-bisphosphoglycerate-independent phosphoglycerate mutase [Candidatus Brocadiia bacterium]